MLGKGEELKSHGFYWGDIVEESFHSGKVSAQKDGISVIDCQKCGFAHRNPIPDVGDFYETELYTSVKPQYIQQYLRDLEWWNLIYADFFDFFEDALPPPSLINPASWVLDFGCGPGFFLDYGHKRRWDCFGVEPSDVARAYADQLNRCILVGPSLDTIKETTMDVVHSYEVFEHLQDPRDTLLQLKDKLKGGGILSITVPNDFNPLQALREEKYWIAPEHINYFTAETIERLIEDCGFDILERRGSFPMELFWLLGSDYVGNDRVGRDCHERRMEMEKRLPKDLRIELYRKMAKVGASREITVFARKR